MHAIMRKKDEAPVAEKALEIQVASLQQGLDEVKTDVRELRADNKSLRDKLDTIYATLRDKIEQLHTKLDNKIDQAVEKLNDRIDQVAVTLSSKDDQNFKTLNDKIDQAVVTLSSKDDQNFKTLNDKIDQNHAAVNVKLDKLSSDFAEMRNLQKATIGVIGGVGSVLSIVYTLGKVLHWF